MARASTIAALLAGAGLVLLPAWTGAWEGPGQSQPEGTPPSPTGTARAAAASRFVVDGDRSQLTIAVGKSGLFGFAGHTHEVVGPVDHGSVELDADDWSRSSVSIVIDASRLRVTGRGEPAGDVPEVQRTMVGGRVLDVERYPTIEFRSRGVKLLGEGPGGARLEVTGPLTLHGQTREIAIATAVARENGTLTARGEFSVKQTTFGIEPVTAGLGTVRVKDELNIQFEVVAHQAPGAR